MPLQEVRSETDGSLFRSQSSPDISNKEVPDFTTTIHELQSTMKEEIRYAQELYQEQADKHRVPAPALRVGDRVWLSTRNICTICPSKKLDQRRMGPYSDRKALRIYRIRRYLTSPPLSMNSSQQ